MADAIDVRVRDDEPLSIVFAIAEASPFVKVGGLADVGSGLPRALARRGHRLRLVLPGFPGLAHGEPAGILDVGLFGSSTRTRRWDLGTHHEVDVSSVSDGVQFGRTYGYVDADIRPFVLFSKAVTNLSGHDPPDVIHLNDWHCGFATEYARTGPDAAALAATATIFTIHNDRYEGPVTPDAETDLGDDRTTSMLGRGIRHADAVNTVSPSYARELVTPGATGPVSTELRHRVDEPLGILNGVDYDDFDPSNDPRLPACFDAADLRGKAVCRFVLQRRVGLDILDDRPLIAMVARIVAQKGVDLVRGALDRILATGAQLVVVGRGDADEEAALRSCERANPGRFAYLADDGESAARLAYAGSDLFLAPSRYEPCGLGPLIALRYGSVPVVHHVGGLVDTIVDQRARPDEGIGFAFAAASADELAAAVGDAVATSEDPVRWTALRARAMATRFTWDDAALRYEQAYRRALGRLTVSAAR